MKSFNQLSEGKLYFDEVDNQPFEEEVDWNVILNISALWNQYENGEINQEVYNKHYAKFLNENKALLENCWTEFEPLIEKLSLTKDIEESNSIYNDIYDVADKNLIKIEIN
jgi:hypothetical protein